MIERRAYHGEDPAKPQCSMGIESSIINYSNNNNRSVRYLISQGFIRSSG